MISKPIKQLQTRLRINQPQNTVIIKLLAATLATFWISTNIPTASAWNSFFLNLSAGLLGSAFTFFWLNRFERQRHRNDALDRLRLHGEYVMAKSTEWSNRMSERLTLLTRAKHLTNSLQQKDHSENIEAIKFKLSVTRHLLQEAEKDYYSLKEQKEFSALMVANAFASGEKDLIEGAEALNELLTSDQPKHFSILESHRADLKRSETALENDLRRLESMRDESNSETLSAASEE